MANFKTLDEIIRKACAYNRRDRFRDMSEVRAALEQLEKKQHSMTDILAGLESAGNYIKERSPTMYNALGAGLKSVGAGFGKGLCYVGAGVKKNAGAIAFVVGFGALITLVSIPCIQQHNNYLMLPDPVPVVRRTEKSSIQTIVNKTPLPKSNTGVLYKNEPVEVIYNRSYELGEREGIYVKYTDGSAKLVVPIMPGYVSGYENSIALSPDKKRIVYASGYPRTSVQLSLVNVDGSNLKKLTPETESALDCEPFWITKDCVGFKRVKKLESNEETWTYYQMNVDKYNNSFNLRKYDKQ